MWEIFANVQLSREKKWAALRSGRVLISGESSHTLGNVFCEEDREDLNPWIGKLTTTRMGRFLSSKVSQPEVFFRKLFLLLYLGTDWGKRGWKRRSIRESLEMFRGKVIKA